MFSNRLHWGLSPNRISLLLDSMRQAGKSILDLTESNPTHAGFTYSGTEIVASFADARALRYDPSPIGPLEAREAVSEYYRERGFKVVPGRVMITASTSESYAFLFKLLADPGDEILVPRPSYPLFEFLAALESVRVAAYPLIYDRGWFIDVEAFAKAITPRTRAVVLVNPNNPTGSFVKQEELESLVELCAPRGIALISDEVFADYAFEPDHGRAETLADAGGVLTFCLSGLSKVAGLPQMKAGWIVMGGPDTLLRTAAGQLELIADTYLSVSAPVQLALPRLLQAGRGVRSQILQRTRGNLEYLRAEISKVRSCELLRVEGGWYAIIRVPRVRTEEEWCLELLEKDGVLVQPGFFYDFESEAYLVLSMLTPPPIFAQGLARVLARADW